MQDLLQPPAVVRPIKSPLYRPPPLSLIQAQSSPSSLALFVLAHREEVVVADQVAGLGCPRVHAGALAEPDKTYNLCKE